MNSNSQDWSDQAITTTLAPIVASVYVLRFTNELTHRKWTLDIRSLPEPEILFTGDTPTVEEMVSCLRYTNFPISAVELFMALAKIAIAAKTR
jgi:hypothetical protein